MKREKVKEYLWVAVWFVIGSYGAGFFSLAFEDDHLNVGWLTISILLIAAFYWICFTKIVYKTQKAELEIGEKWKM